ncbi:MAG: hypothetical protein JXB36_11870 [Gammaproteobacteria bacterium]|nr:hypothetical protein [Gammaproteobacteria bacterium]
MYETDDPRSRLSTASAGSAKASSTFGVSTYARFYDTAPQYQDDGQRTWYARGQNFVVAYSETRDGATLGREDQPDEYVLLLPDDGRGARITAGGETKDAPGYSVTFVPPGDSVVEMPRGGRAIRLITSRSADLAGLASNAVAYRRPDPHIPPFEPWPDPPGGFAIRTYSLDVPDKPGRFGKIWRCTTFMVNVFPPQHGPRDPAKLSPHHHDDFQQASLAIGGSYVHHLRWPWTADQSEWREDEHELCGSPSLCVIPARVIHTSAAVDPGVNLLVDIFSPPRADFSAMPGWVLNADDYPAPPQ